MGGRLRIVLVSVLSSFLFFGYTAWAQQKGDVPQRDFRSFVPQERQLERKPSGHIIQLLMNHQPDGDSAVYLVQMIYRGELSRRHRIQQQDSSVVIELLNIGRSQNRIPKIRGGHVLGSRLDPFHYLEKNDSLPSTGTRLTLFLSHSPEVKVRHTLDRTLLHFRLPLPPERSDNRRSNRVTP